MERKSKHYDPLHVLEKTKQGLDKYIFDDDLIKVCSLRMRTFANKGIKCVKCGLEGKFFVKEKHINCNVYHFNLYAIDDNGLEILMTHDHIIPISKGGKNTLENTQTMCCICNLKKGNKLEEI